MVERKKQLVRDKVSRLVNWGHWFALVNGLLALVVGSRYLDTVGMPETAIGWGYLAIASIGQFSFLAFLLYLLLLFPITLLLPYSKILRGLAATTATLGLCILLYDTIVYEDYGIHLSPFAFDVAWADLNALLHGTSYIVTPLGIMALELLVANFLWKRIERIEKLRLGSKVAAIVGSCFVASHLVHIWGDAADVSDITRYDDAYPLFYPATAKSFMETHGLDRRNQDDQSRNAQTLAYPINPLQCQVQQPVNVLVVAIDSLRADMVTSDTMPFLSQYGKINQSFNQHLSGGNQFQSGMFSLLYGLQGSYMGAPDFQTTPPLLTHEFAQAGYQLKRFSPASNDNKLRPLAIFNDFSSELSDDSESRARADIHSRKAFDIWRRQQSAPWFALVNLGAPETYDTPVGFTGAETIKPPRELAPAQRVLFNQYRQSLYFTDGELKTLIEQLPADTLVIVTGVNGKAFTSNEAEAHGDLSPQTVHVPLIIHWPGGEKGTTSYTTSHHGIAPTLMTHVIGCSNAATDYSAGRQLLSPSEQPWVYVGDNRVFAIYQNDEITVINRHGKYDIYSGDFSTRLNKKISAPDLIQVMREGRRLFRH